jgi:hypothetical protein
MSHYSKTNLNQSVTSDSAVYRVFNKSVTLYTENVFLVYLFAAERLHMRT